MDASRAASTSAAASRTCRSSSATRSALLERGGPRGRDRRRASCEGLSLDADSRGAVGRSRARRRGGHDRAQLSVLALPAARAARAAADARRARGIWRASLVAVGPHASTTPARDAAQARRRRGRPRRVRRGARRARARRRATIGRTSPAMACARWRRAGAGQRRTAGGGHDGPAARSRWPDELHRAPRAPSPPLRRRARAARAPRWRPRAAARITALLREGQLPRPLPQAAAADACCEELDALIAAGRRLRLLHRRDLPARRAAARGARRARGFSSACRRASTTGRREMLELLGAAGCVSIEAGVESISAEGRGAARQALQALDRGADRAALSRARAASLRAGQPAGVAASTIPTRSHAWRERLQRHGVWANEPVPLFPYPGSPDYTRCWGAPDDAAWERAHDALLPRFRPSATSRRQRPASGSPSWSTSAPMRDTSAAC